MSPKKTEAEVQERDAQVKATIQQIRARVLGSLTFDEIKGLVLKLTDTQRIELAALLTKPR